MQVHSSRFGILEISPADLLWMPEGMVGYEADRHWTIIPDDRGAGCLWLQSIREPETAFALLHPAQWIPEYRLVVDAGTLARLGGDTADRIFVWVPVARAEEGFQLQLQLPVVINASSRCGLQLIVAGQMPLDLSHSPRDQLGTPEVPLAVAITRTTNTSAA
ncbi:MAG: flagellar assembly protein FliW [Pirellulaceae bacterium]|jgi:flagellar assembly factor FliW